MELITELSLGEFYEALRSEALHRKHRVLILALVREADAPGFYDDVSRYWDSLDDVTGRHVLFAVAGPSAERLGHGSAVINKYSNRAFSFTKHAAIAARTGSETIQDRDLEMALERQSFELRHSSQPAARYTLEDISRKALSIANTSQISDLRNKLKLTERDLPCLHVTLLDNKDFPCITIPMRLISNFSIYTACKDIIDHFGATIEWEDEEFVFPQDPGQDADLATARSELHEHEARWRRLNTKIQSSERKLEEIESEIKSELQRQKQSREHLVSKAERADSVIAKSVSFLLASVEHEPSSPAGQVIIQINEACRNGDLSQLNELFDASQDNSILSTEQLHHCRRIVGALADKMRNLEFVPLEQLERVLRTKSNAKRNELQSELNRLRDTLGAAKEARDNVYATVETLSSARGARIAAHDARRQSERESWLRSKWEPARAKLNTLAPRLRVDANLRDWRFFISYPSQDRELAAAIFSELETHGRTFLDYRCLMPGQNWREVIPQAQDRSRSSVIVVTRHTAESHYQNSEIERAILLKRRLSHGVYPIYENDKVPQPFGLEQIQSIRLYGSEGHSLIRQKVRLVALDAPELPTAVSIPIPEVAAVNKKPKQKRGFWTEWFGFGEKRKS